MSRKLTYEEVKESVESLGYELISSIYIDSKKLIVIKDKDGFYYEVTYSGFKNKKNPLKFHKSNPYTIKNIQLWLKLNLPFLELISKEYINTNKDKLIFKNEMGYHYTSTLQNLLSGRTLSEFHELNPFRSDNIHLCLQLNFPDLQLISNFNNLKEKLVFKDREGYYYFTILHNLIYNNCSPSKFHKSNPYTIQNIKLWCILNNKPFKLLDNQIFIGADKKLKWKCLKNNCGETFKLSWNSVSQGHNCGYCSGMQVGLSNCLATKNPELAKEWHPTKNGDLTPYDVTCGSGKKVWWQCKDDKKHEWRIDVSNRNNLNSGCPYCSGLYSSEDYNLLVINPELCEEWNYSKNWGKPEEYCPNSNKDVWWICMECGNEWKSSISNRSKINGTGCPECNESKGEKRITKWLHCNSVYYIPQKMFYGLIGVGNGLLSYDFYIPRYNFLIEYQGEFHEKQQKHVNKKKFEAQKEHDKRKKEYAINNGYNLLEIWYWDFENIETILEKHLLKFKEEVK